MAAGRNKNKKKGGSGKLARKKAKLERQWGEEVDESQKVAYTRGLNATPAEKKFKSRIGLEESAIRQDDNENSGYVEKTESSDEEEGESNLGNGQALDSLLTRIKNKRRQDKVTFGHTSESSTKWAEKDLYDIHNNGESIADGSDDEESSSGSDEEQDMIVETKEDEENDIKTDEGTQIQKDAYAKFFSTSEKEIGSVEAKVACEKILPIPFQLEDTRHMKVYTSNMESLGVQNVDKAFDINTRAVLKAVWRRFNKKSLKARKGNQLSGIFTPIQSLLYPSLSTYVDIMLNCVSRENRKEIYDVLSLHVMNHLIFAHERVNRHNRRVREIGKEKKQISIEDRASKVLRDQGFTKPKVLVLCPTRGTALSFMRRFLELPGPLAEVDGWDRFQDDFGVDAMENNEEDNRRKLVLKSKGDSWLELFGDDVNDDDDFKFGFSIKNVLKKKEGKRVGVKLYTDFYKSDCILASPLSLKLHLEREDDNDFLSSIEICTILHSDVLLMQNWDHVMGVMKAINQQPKKMNETDFSRVRQYFLSKKAENFRQLICLAPFNDANLIGTFKRHAKSFAGRLRVGSKVSVSSAAICDVNVKVKQVFQRIPCSSIAEQGAAKVKYFAEKILPELLKLKQKHTLVYIPSYFEFCSVRNLLLKEGVNFVSVTEYARVTEISRGRSRFQQGRKRIMLYTGRCHFFKRHKILGARHLIFFGLPEHGEFYPDMVNVLDEVGKQKEGCSFESPISCLSLFTRYEAHCLERIVGSSHCSHMLKSEKNTYLFSS